METPILECVLPVLGTFGNQKEKSIEMCLYYLRSTHQNQNLATRNRNEASESENANCSEISEQNGE